MTRTTLKRGRSSCALRNPWRVDSTVTQTLKPSPLRAMPTIVSSPSSPFYLDTGKSTPTWSFPLPALRLQKWYVTLHSIRSLYFSCFATLRLRGLVHKLCHLVPISSSDANVFQCRFTNEVLLASHPQSTSGPTTAASRLRPPTIPISFESK